MLWLGGPGGLAAQNATLDSQRVEIKLQQDSPVALLSTTMGQSSATARGAALVLDLHMSLTLRNNTTNRIRGVTLRVVSQEVAVGGKASVSVPSLNVGPGEAFPIHIDLQLMRPTQAGRGPLAQVDLDGVLFQDLSFYGPDRLHSRRSMTAWELEAQRDREYFKRVLAQSGPQGLQREMLNSLTRQAERPQLDVRVARRPAVSAAGAAVSNGQTVQFAFLDFKDAPVEPVDGWAELSGNEARAPRIQVRNRSTLPVKYVEVAWLVSDQQGQQYMAASVPASDPDLVLRPGETARVLQDSELRFSRNGEPVNIRKMTGFVSQVQFADGKVWVPNRQNLESTALLPVLAPSPEEQRLADFYLKHGIAALVEELRKY